MIALTTPTYDLNGHLVIHREPANLYEAARRGSVTETLDGGVSVYDTGYSTSAQTLRVSIRRPAKDTLVQLRYLVAYYGQLIVCCEIGAYRAVPSFALDRDTLNLQLRLVGRLDGG